MMQAYHRRTLTWPLCILLTAMLLLIMPIPAKVVAQQSPDDAAKESAHQLIFKAYHIGDLVDAINYPVTSDDPNVVAYAKLTRFADSLKTMVAPESWNDETSILLLPDTVSLVIRQAESVHAQMAGLLEELRTVIPPENYRLRPGDVLQVYIETITEPPHFYPVYEQSEHGVLPPRTGYTVPVRDDGTVLLPKMMHALDVEGMTVAEAQTLFRRAYVHVLQILGHEAEIAVSLIPQTSSPKQDQAFELLEQPFICNFAVNVKLPAIPEPEDYRILVPLQSVLDHIHEKSTLPVVTSDEVLAQLGDPQEIIVLAHMPFAMPLKDFLDYLVRQIDMAWHFEDGTIKITTTDEISNRDNELLLRVYSIGDLARLDGISGNYGIRAPSDLEAIAAYFRTMVEPKTWDEERFIRVDYHRVTILVRQTEDCHAQIAKLLISMRNFQLSEYRAVYAVMDLVDSDDDMEALIRLIMETATPDAWGKLASIRAAEDRPEYHIDVTHDRKGHQSIKNLLKQLQFNTKVPFSDAVESVIATKLLVAGMDYTRDEHKHINAITGWHRDEKVTLEILKTIRVLPHLKKLTIYDVTGNKDALTPSQEMIDAVVALESLEQLSFVNVVISSELMQAVATMKNLDTLSKQRPNIGR